MMVLGLLVMVMVIITVIDVHICLFFDIDDEDEGSCIVGSTLSMKRGSRIYVGYIYMGGL